MKTYQGQCHCGAVAFEVTTDLDSVNRCNCSICTKKGAPMHRVTADRFKLLRGEDAITTYEFGSNIAKHYFCKTCGIYPFHRPRIAPDEITVNVNCLDGVADVDALPINRIDGRTRF